MPPARRRSGPRGARRVCAAASVPAVASARLAPPNARPELLPGPPAACRRDGRRADGELPLIHSHGREDHENDLALYGWNTWRVLSLRNAGCRAAARRGGAV